MFGAIAGDMIGSSREFRNPPIKTKDFPLFTPDSKFTDDSVATAAIARAILTDKDYGSNLHSLCRYYIYDPKGKEHDCGWGRSFYLWLISSNPTPYNSFGNGSAMRVSPVGWAFNTEEEVLKNAELSALPSHNHPEGIKGAQATALSIFMVRNGVSNEEIKSKISSMFGYDLNRTVDSIRPNYHFDVTCQGSVPESIICFLEATSYEDTVRNAVSLGGDTDTQAVIAGSIAEARWGVPDSIKEEVIKRLDDSLLQIVTEFEKAYIRR